jgi:hypothetical protein
MFKKTTTTTTLVHVTVLKGRVTVTCDCDDVTCCDSATPKRTHNMTITATIPVISSESTLTVTNGAPTVPPQVFT